MRAFCTKGPSPSDSPLSCFSDFSRTFKATKESFLSWKEIFQDLVMEDEEDKDVWREMNPLPFAPPPQQKKGRSPRISSSIALTMKHMPLFRRFILSLEHKPK